MEINFDFSIWTLFFGILFGLQTFCVLFFLPSSNRQVHSGIFSWAVGYTIAIDILLGIVVVFSWMAREWMTGAFVGYVATVVVSSLSYLIVKILFRKKIKNYPDNYTNASKKIRNSSNFENVYGGMMFFYLVVNMFFIVYLIFFSFEEVVTYKNNDGKLILNEVFYKTHVVRDAEGKYYILCEEKEGAVIKEISGEYSQIEKDKGKIAEKSLKLAKKLLKDKKIPFKNISSEEASVLIE